MINASGGDAWCALSHRTGGEAELHDVGDLDQALSEVADRALIDGPGGHGQVESLVAGAGKGGGGHRSNLAL